MTKSTPATNELATNSKDFFIAVPLLGIRGGSSSRQRGGEHPFLRLSRQDGGQHPFEVAELRLVVLLTPQNHLVRFEPVVHVGDLGPMLDRGRRFLVRQEVVSQPVDQRRRAVR